LFQKFLILTTTLSINELHNISIIIPLTLIVLIILGVIFTSLVKQGRVGVVEDLLAHGAALLELFYELPGLFVFQVVLALLVFFF